MGRVVWVVAGLLCVAGCVSPEQQRALDVQRCGGYGFPPGSYAMSSCLMGLDQQREAQADADRRAAAADRERSYYEQNRYDRQRRYEQERYDGYRRDQFDRQRDDRQRDDRDRRAREDDDRRRRDDAQRGQNRPPPSPAPPRPPPRAPFPNVACPAPSSSIAPPPGC